jgi:DNA polymerase-3 subunit gamma/tau
MSVIDAWEQTVKAQVKPIVRALYSAGSFVGQSADASWQFSVPNEAHGGKCDEHRPAVEAALAAVVGAPVTIEFVVGGRSLDDPGGPPPDPTPGGVPRPAPRSGPSGRERAAMAAAAVSDEPDEPEVEAYVPEADEDVDLAALTDAPPESVKTPIDRLAEAFPGSELMTDE